MKLKDLHESTLNESVTFSLDINDENDEYSDIMSICHVGARIFYEAVKANSPFFYKHLQDNRFNIRFEPDGDDYDQPTGTVNVYTGRLVTDHFYEDFMQALNVTVAKLKTKVDIGPLKVEGDKKEWDSPRAKYNEGDSAATIGVVRIPIIKNELAQSVNPEMNVANANARALLKVLGLDSEELSGSIEYQDIPRLMMQIRNLADGVVDDNVRAPESSQNTRIDRSGGMPRITKGAMFHDMGLEARRIQEYLDRLLIILKQAQERQVGVVYG